MKKNIHNLESNINLDKYYSINEICEKLRICRSTFYKDQELDTNFPEPIIVGRRAPRYLWSDFLEYLEQKREAIAPAARGGAND